MNPDEIPSSGKDEPAEIGLARREAIGRLTLTRQFARAHQEFVDGARALAAFAVGPDHQ